MKLKTASLFVGIIFLLSVSQANAITVRVAEVQNGVAVIQGNKAVPNATILWEGATVTQANNGGSFSFSGVVPADCVGTLSDGTAIEVALLNCTPVSIVAASLPHTGQTTSYDLNSPQRDDGALQAGIQWPNPRFTDGLNGTIRDHLTGLIWLKNGSCTLAKTWQEALDFIVGINSGSNSCGDTSNSGSHQTDWRLPNILELHSLINYHAADRAAYLNSAGFNSVVSLGGPYWSSTTVAHSSGVNAWAIGFAPGGFLGERDKSNPAWVWAVRGGS
jgi:hypothetical protein